MTSNTKASIFLLVCIIAAAGYLFYRLNEEAPAQERQAFEFNSRELKGTIETISFRNAGHLAITLNTSDTEYIFLPESTRDAEFWSFPDTGDLFIKHAFGDSVTVIHKGVLQRFKLGGR